MFLIFSLGSSNIFPSGDLGFIKAISKLYKKKLPLNESYLKKDDFKNSISEYENALSYLSKKSRKIKMYSKLVLLTERHQDLNKTIEYLDNIYLNSNNKDNSLKP